MRDVASCTKGRLRVDFPFNGPGYTTRTKTLSTHKGRHHAIGSITE